MPEPPSLWDQLTAPDRDASQQVTDLNGGLTPHDLVEALIGEGVTYENVTYTGDPRGAGLGAGFEAALGVDGGVLLSSGSLAGELSNVIGPNVNHAQTTQFDAPGDADLDGLVAPYATLDATTLEFDFVSDADQISFQYIFGSEEYNEYVGSAFDDVFAFYVDGENCAVVGADAQRVSVNTVNAGQNAELYVDNELPEAAHDTELDGFTSVLTCAAAVEPGESHHLKLVIADTSDPYLDSTVLIAAGTFQANHPPVADDQAVETEMDTPVDITLTGSDPDGDPITFGDVSDPANGELSGTEPDLVYTPDDGFTGEDEFTFTVSDGAAVSAPATVTVTVEGGSEPTDEPTDEPSPTDEPTDEPTNEPSPTDEPTDEPSDEPTGEPTGEPTPQPTEQPTDEPDDQLPDTGTDARLILVAGAVLAGVALALLRRARTTS
ncbi:choice-of-anchor L domain-containing protein [Jiangella asiatica]|uniref:LPXTG cell wall anchor domain-containing protein n=1 Tax=Jiangella asiatica TaxID=2530372 RepID=A0A4R5CPI8_9ACTN|nr:choice-of-anchor L domain-containing protein [Jiangella asiatica]TDE00701.1 LPXTG cell wall anchor domain-containing protein [Jiangella asiatica]